MRKIEQRLLSGDDDEATEPVKILVMGGSVIMGVKCYTQPRNIKRKECAWPKRLEMLLNYGFDKNKKMFEVHNAATGGINSAAGASILRSGVLQGQMANPDIII
jgi:predicted PP-loop superfamily ATPase